MFYTLKRGKMIKAILLGIVLILIVGCTNIETEETLYSWSCDRIECPSFNGTGANITCGNYEVWGRKCTMTNCTKPIKCT